MSQPMGFKTAAKENMVCKLKKLLYGLNHILRQWYKNFDNFIRGKSTHIAIMTHVRIIISHPEESTSISYCM